MSLEYGALDPVSDLAAEPAGLVVSGAPLTGPAAHAPLFALQGLVDTAGLTGYNFSATLAARSDLDRLRAELWEHGTWPNTLPLAQRTLRRWLLRAGEKFPFAVAGNVQSGEDLEFIFPAGHYSKIRTSFSVSLAYDGIAAGSSATYPEYRFKCLFPPGTFVLLAGISNNQGQSLNNGASFARGIRASDGASIGPLDWSPKTFWDVGKFGNGVITTTAVLPVRDGDYFVLPAFTATFNAAISSASTSIQFFFIIETIAGTNMAGGNFARVLSSVYSSWSRMGQREIVWPSNFPNGEGVSVFATATPLPPSTGAGFWRARGGPSAARAFECFASPSEFWKYNRRSLYNDTAIKPNIVEPSLAYPPLQTDTLLKRYVRTPFAKLSAALFPDPTPPPLPADQRTRSDTNAFEFDTFNFTLGAAAGTQDFSLPALRTGFTAPVLYMGGTPHCQYWKLPLAGFTREKYLEFTYNSAVANITAARTEVTGDVPTDVYAGGEVGLIGSQATEYAFHAALTTPDLGTFWYRDVGTHHPSQLGTGTINTIKRFPRWAVRPDGAGYALYLFNPTQTVQTGINPTTGAPIFSDVSFYPTGGVSAEDYRTAFKVGVGDLFVGNFPDYQPAYRYFPTAGKSTVNGPVAAWTVGKQIGGPFAPGLTVKFHIQRRLPRSEAVDFQIRKQAGYEDGINRNVGLLYRPSVGFPSVVHDVQTSRFDRKNTILVFRNKVGVIGLYPDVQQRGRLRDLRLFTLALLPVAGDGITNGGATPYYQEILRDYVGLASDFAREINPGDYSVAFDSVTGTTTITLRRGDGTFGDAFKDEFLRVGVSYDHFSGYLPRLEVTYGNRTRAGLLPGENIFTPYRRAVIAPGEKSAPPFYDNDGPVSQKWTRLDAWALLYQRTFNLVDWTYAAPDYTYQPVYPAAQPGVSITGILVSAVFREDCSLRFYGGWKSRRTFSYAEVKAHTAFTGTFSGDVLQIGAVVFSGHYRQEFSWQAADGEKALNAAWNGTVLKLTRAATGLEIGSNEQVIENHTEHYLTQQNFNEGPQFVAPIGGSIEATARLVAFQPVVCRQNFEVRSSWIELGSGGAAPEIVGPPMSFHLNETGRLVEKWMEAGRPPG